MTQDERVFASQDDGAPEFNLEELVNQDLDEGPIGVFRSWRTLYTTVVVYSLVTVVVLYLVSVALDFNAG